MFEFLSKEWFIHLEKINKKTPDLPLAPSIASLTINVEVGSDTALHLKHGKIHQGKLPEAQATLQFAKPTLEKLLLKPSKSFLMTAFLGGDIRVEGDMSALLALQSVKPTPEQKQLYKDILAMTQFDDNPNGKPA